MDHIYSGWRLTQPPGHGGDGLPNVEPPRSDGQTLFEAIEQSERPDRETYILRRWSSTFAILNVFPYTSGHVMVLPRVAAATLDELPDETHDELWRLVRTVSVVVKRALSPQGLNIGVNEGQAGGGSIPDHLHVHVVPRWSSDTNFMTATADTRVLPMTLAHTWEVLIGAWTEQT